MKISLTPEEIEYYHDKGQMPDWIYYQVNGKTAQENYAIQKRKRQKEVMEWLEERRRREQEAKEQKELEAEIEKKACEIAEKAIEDIFKDFLK